MPKIIQNHDYLNVFQHNRRDFLQVATKNEFVIAGREYIVKEIFVAGEYGISVRAAPFDYQGKVSKALGNRGWNQLYFKSETLPLGKYVIDEDESDEDEIFAYYEG